MDVREYDRVFEQLMISILITNSTILTRVLGILKSSYFDDVKCKKTIQFILDYYTEYSTIPLPDQVKATTHMEVDLVPEVAYDHDSWALAELEKFCKYKALKEAIYASPTLLDEGRYGEVEAAVKAAVQIALVKDLGLDYYANPKERLEALRDNKGQMSTGWKTVDDKLYGGLNRGEITIFAGQSGAGKSLFLQNLAVNWAQVGLNVAYLSLELSENLCAHRIDAMHTNFETREIMKNIDDVHIKVRAIQQKSKGSLQIKQLKNGCTSNDIRAYIKEYELNSGKKVDAILIDYLDLMFPISKKISAENLFVKDKYVTEELRNLAVELQIVMVSASQLNRGSYEEIEFDPSHIAGGISKVNTADNVIGIFTSAAMKEGGRYQIQFMKTRSSSGVGSKIDLAFNPKSLRITDLDENDDSAIMATSKNTLDILKRSSVIKSSEKQPPKTSDETSMTSDRSSTLERAADLMALIKKK